MAHLAILADDLTGAADAGGGFASAGWRTVLAFGDMRVEGLDVLVRSTDSRGLDATAAADANRRTVREIQELPTEQRPRWVHKKIDSALRGHPCEELVAVMIELGERRAIVAPALPAEGRTTIRSRQLIGGTLAADIAWASPNRSADLIARFACDDFVGVRSLGLATVRRGVEHVARFINDTNAGIIVADAETDQDLAAIARGALTSGIRVMAGSAGLARQLATALPLPASATQRIPTILYRTASPVLIVAASRHNATAAQVASLSEAGVPVVRPSKEAIDGSDSSTTTLANALDAHLEEGRSVVLTTSGLGPSRLGPTFVAEHIASVVTTVAQRRSIGGLVLTGGDIAATVLDRLEASQIMVGGEVRAAMPWGMLRSRLPSEVAVVTKAGSFGEDDALLACVEHLRGISVR